MESTQQPDKSIDDFIRNLNGEEREILDQTIPLPNDPDVQAQVMVLHFKYGEKYTEVLQKIEELRVKLDYDYDTLRGKILEKIG